MVFSVCDCDVACKDPVYVQNSGLEQLVLMCLLSYHISGGVNGAPAVLCGSQCALYGIKSSENRATEMSLCSASSTQLAMWHCPHLLLNVVL